MDSDHHMDPIINAFVTSLIAVNDWNRQYRQIEEWAFAGRTDILLGIAETVSGSSCPDGISFPAREAIKAYILRCLALTPSEVTADAALSCSLASERLVAPDRHSHKPRHLASLLAYGQSHETLQALFERHGTDLRHHELLACLVQEVLLRSAELPPAAVNFQERQVTGRNHPLGCLPLRILPQERMFGRYLPSYGARSTCISTLPIWGDRQRTPPGSPEPGPAVAVRWTPAKLSENERNTIWAAMQSWMDESNGKVEVGAFWGDTILAVIPLIARSLLSLPMECLRGTSAKDITVRTVPLSEALSNLFSAASTGGAYDNGQYGAYGRLAAWRSLGALVGATEGTPVDTVASMAEHCVWMTFEANTEWFYRVAWDLGLAVLRPDGRTVAALAATDTD